MTKFGGNFGTLVKESRYSGGECDVEIFYAENPAIINISNHDS